jgi:hypothetical protein
LFAVLLLESLLNGLLNAFECMMLVGMFMGLLGMLAILSLSNFLIIFLLNLFVLSYLFLKLFGSILGFVYLPFLFSLLVLFLL